MANLMDSTAGKPLDQSSARIQWIDAIKGLGISLIVIGHIWALDDRSLFYEWIFAFHVPLFFFAAGLNLKPKITATLAFARLRSQQLMTPYIMFALIGYLFHVGGYLLTKGQTNPPAAFADGLWIPLFGILEGRVGDGRLVNSPLWFLPALLIALVVCHAINNRLQNTAARLAIVAMMSGIALWVGDGMALPFSINAALIGLLFIQVGFEYRRVGFPLPHRSNGAIGLLALAFAITLFAPLNAPVDLAKATVNQPLLYLLFAGAGIIFCMIGTRIAPSIIQSWLARIGRHSLVILVTHMLIIKAVKVGLYLITGISIDTMEHSVLIGLAVLAITCLIMLPTGAVIIRWFPWMLGQKSRPLAPH